MWTFSQWQGRTPAPRSIPTMWQLWKRPIWLHPRPQAPSSPSHPPIPTFWKLSGHFWEFVAPAFRKPRPITSNSSKEACHPWRWCHMKVMRSDVSKPMYPCLRTMRHGPCEHTMTFGKCLYWCLLSICFSWRCVLSCLKARGLSEVRWQHDTAVRSRDFCPGDPLPNPWSRPTIRRSLWRLFWTSLWRGGSGSGLFQSRRSTETLGLPLRNRTAAPFLQTCPVESEGLTCLPTACTWGAWSSWKSVSSNTCTWKISPKVCWSDSGSQQPEHWLFSSTSTSWRMNHHRKRLPGISRSFNCKNHPNLDPNGIQSCIIHISSSFRCIHFNIFQYILNLSRNSSIFLRSCQFLSTSCQLSRSCGSIHGVWLPLRLCLSWRRPKRSPDTSISMRHKWSS